MGDGTHVLRAVFGLASASALLAATRFEPPVQHILTKKLSLVDTSRVVGQRAANVSLTVIGRKGRVVGARTVPDGQYAVLQCMSCLSPEVAKGWRDSPTLTGIIVFGEPMDANLLLLSAGPRSKLLFSDKTCRYLPMQVYDQAPLIVHIRSGVITSASAPTDDLFFHASGGL